MTGKKLWELNGSTEECVGTMVTDGVRVFASGGYPRNHTVAIVADGSGKVAWENNTRVYVPSMIAKEGYLYAVLDLSLIHISEPTRLLSISYAVFCLKKK